MKITIERKTSQEKKFVQFSKRCLGAMIVLWFIGAVFGFAVCIVQLIRGELVSLSDLLMYIGAPMTGGIVSYMIKSAWEKKKTIHDFEGDNIYEHTEI